MFQFARSLTKSWLKRAQINRLNAPKRARLGMEALEARVVPVTWLVNLPDGLGACNPASVSLRQAVICANPVNDTIQINLPGNYPLTFPGAPGDANPASGDIDIIGKTGLTIQADPNLPQCSVTIDAQWADRIFDVASNSGVRIRGINLVNGVAWDAGYGLTEEGGAVRNFGTTRYERCLVQNNAADRGGAFGNLTGILAVDNAILDSNWAMTSGGGIFHRGNGLQITNSMLSQNIAATGGGVHSQTNVNFVNSALRNNGASFGGGLYNTGSALHNQTIYAANWAWEGGAINTVGPSSSVLLQNRSDLYLNQADRGGGVFSESSVLTVTDTILDSNYATREGGAIWAIAGRLRIESSTFSYNAAGVDGGAIWTGSNTLLFNSTISTNYAGNFGGGVHYLAAPFGSLLVRHATVTENWAMFGGGLYTQAGGGPAALLHNSIVAINYEYGGSFDDVAGALLDANGFNNLFSQLSLWGLTVPNGNQFSTNPLLQPLANNGGPTPTHALVAASPAVNAASTNVNHMLPTDQRGNARPASSPDIGAFEL